jgi:hypothetical protein
MIREKLQQKNKNNSCWADWIIQQQNNLKRNKQLNYLLVSPSK